MLTRSPINPTYMPQLFTGISMAKPELELLPTDVSYQSTAIKSPGLTFSRSFSTCLLNSTPTTFGAKSCKKQSDGKIIDKN